MLVSCCVRSGMILGTYDREVATKRVSKAKKRERDGVSVGDTVSEGIASRDDVVARVLTDVVVARVVWPCGWPTIWAALTFPRGRHHWTERLKGDRPVGNPHPSLACGCSGYCYGGCYGGGGV